MLLTCSDPSIASVAPHGAVEGRFTPNPIAAGWPTEGEPVIVDVCPSTTTNGMAARLARNGERFPGPWLIDHAGNTTDDPAVLSREPKGAILPLGGDDLGHKGFALALIVEMMTASLGGFGRADANRSLGRVRVSPDLRPGEVRRRGRVSARKQRTWFSPAAPQFRGPGTRRAHAGRTRARRTAASTARWRNLHPDIAPMLEPWARKFGIPMPAAIRTRGAD